MTESREVGDQLKHDIWFSVSLQLLPTTVPEKATFMQTLQEIPGWQRKASRLKRHSNISCKSVEEKSTWLAEHANGFGTDE